MQKARQNDYLFSKTKRTLDILGAVSAITLTSPLMLLAAIGVLLSMGLPVLFKQERPGLYGKSFVMYKFRTMRDRGAIDGHAMPDEERVTGFGGLLRRASLDELPELFNVLRGEMSLVGPRPLLTEYVHRYTSEQARRHNAKPGITGWAQIHGRQSISLSTRMLLDVWYVDNASLWLDIKILLRTTSCFMSSRGFVPIRQLPKLDDLAPYLDHDDAKREGEIL